MSCKPRSRGECRLPRRRGRPVQIDPAARAEIVLDAAAGLLGAVRLDEITMDTIADRAGMSKRTLYSLFDSREALLEASIARLIRALFEPPQPMAPELPLADRLRRLLTVNKVAAGESCSLEILRTIIAEAHTYPGLARRTREEGHETRVRCIAAELEAAAGRGEIALAPDRIGLAAEVLVNMTFANVVSSLLSTDPADPAGIELMTRETARADERRELALAIFLRGVGAATPPPAAP